MVLKLSAEDIKNARPWPDGWYEAEQETVIESLAAKKDSINTDITFKIIHPTTGLSKDVQCKINNKNMEMFNKRIVSYLTAVGAITDEAKGFEGELKDLNGSKLKVHIFTDTFGGVPTNRVDEFLSITAGGSEIPLNI